VDDLPRLRVEAIPTTDQPPPPPPPSRHRFDRIAKAWTVLAFLAIVATLVVRSQTGDGASPPTCAASRPCDVGDLAARAETASYECTNGRTLYWNHEFWGYFDGALHRLAPGESVPPALVRTACLGTPSG
jgi:hypothetical protein